MNRTFLRAIFFALLLSGFSYPAATAQNNTSATMGMEEQRLINRYLLQLQQALSLQSAGIRLAKFAHPRLLNGSGSYFRQEVEDIHLGNDFVKADDYPMPPTIVTVRQVRKFDGISGNSQIPGVVKAYTLRRKPAVNAARPPGEIWLFIPNDTTRTPLLYEIGKL